MSYGSNTQVYGYETHGFAACKSICAQNVHSRNVKSEKTVHNMFTNFL